MKDFSKINGIEIPSYTDKEISEKLSDKDMLEFLIGEGYIDSQPDLTKVGFSSLGSDYIINSTLFEEISIDTRNFYNYKMELVA